SSSRMRTTFSTPVTPTRESPTAIAGVRAWTSSPAPVAAEAGVVTGPACTSTKGSGPPRAHPRDISPARPAILVSLPPALRWVGPERVRAQQAQPQSYNAGVKRNAQEA